MNTEQLSHPALNRHLAAQELGNCCSNCGKRGEPTCCEYKENGRRPGDGDWCWGYKSRRKT